MFDYDEEQIALRLYETAVDLGYDGRTSLKCYIAGPMRGLPEYNYPAFNAAAELLRSVGWEVFNPADTDAEVHEEVAGSAHPLKVYMRQDLNDVCHSDAVFVLPGWEDSEGADIEVYVAQGVGVPVYSFLSCRPIEKTARVQQVDPEHNPEYVMGPGDEVPRLATPEEATTLGIALSAISRGVRLYGEFSFPTNVLPTDSAARKALPLTTGVLDYFPAALVAVAAVSKAGNDKHNPGEPLHHSRGKSADHADAIGRHLLERGHVDADNGLRHSAQLAWRALALLQVEIEEAGEAPLARGAKAA